LGRKCRLVLYFHYLNLTGLFYFRPVKPKYLMPKPHIYRGKRTVPLLQSQSQWLTEAVNVSDDQSIGGVKTFLETPLVPDEAYDAGVWNGLLEVPTKNAVRDKIEDILDGVTFTGDVVVPAEAYGVGWNGSDEVPTKNDVYDKIETVVAGIPSAYTDEMAQDTVGGILADSTTIDFTYTDVTPEITAIVKDNSLGAGKLTATATDILFGRSTGGAGAGEEVACTAAGRTIIAAADASAQRTALGLVIGTDVQAYDADLGVIAGLSPSNDDFLQRKAGSWANRTIAQVKTDLSLTGTNSGDQTSIVGISGTKAEFDTACSDGNFLYLGDVTQYTDELAQDAVGGILTDTATIDFTYADATPEITADVKDASISNTKLTTTAKTSVIGFIIDGGGSTITTGIKGDLSIEFGCTITQVTLLADQSGSIVIDIWKDTYANYPPTDADSITAAAPPTISTATKSQDATLTGWTTTISAGDTLRFNVDSVTTIQRVTLILKVTKT